MGSPRVKEWSEDEDRVLRDLVQEHGEKRWKAIGEDFKKHFPETRRSPIHCRERYMNHLRSGLIKGTLTSEEVQLIFDLHRRHANRWALIAKDVPGRTQNTIKVFFYSALKKAKDKFNRERPASGRCTRTIRSLVRDPKVTQILNMGRPTHDREDNALQLTPQGQPAREDEGEVWRRWVCWWNYFIYLNFYSSSFNLY